MNATDWIVTVAALAGIGWVNWYFLLAERGAGQAMPTSSSAGGASPSSGAGQSVTIVVRGGYEPSTVRVRAGEPVRLTFDRRETSSCSEEVVFPAFGLRRFLPANQRTIIVVTPPVPGTYEFACGMSMLHGRLVAE